MAAPTGYPSWIYNATQQSALIINTVAQFNALPSPGTWTTTPYVGIGSIAPTDPGFTDTDIRLQQILVECRVMNQMLQIGLNVVDDPVTQIRPDVLANDSALTT
jgi:hypothetical protein